MDEPAQAFVSVDLLLTKPDQAETETRQDELSRQKTEDSD
jgi:hypothetical protein